MIAINLNNLDGIPKTILDELSNFNELFKRIEFMEELESEWQLQELVEKIDNFCLKNEIIGFHYTRAYPEDIMKKGLMSRSGKEIRRNFLENYRSLFTQMEIKKIVEVWERSFDESDEQHRDHHVFFNFTLDALNNGGAELLLENFGGEQVYFPIYSMNGIGAKIKKIGIPLILKCTLNPNNLNTFIEHPWGKIAVSTYHRTQNLNAHVIDQDGYQLIPVPPKNIELIEYP